MDRMERVDLMEETLLEQLGAETFLNELCRGLSYDEKEDLFEYIARNWNVDINFDNDIDEEEEDDD